MSNVDRTPLNFSDNQPGWVTTPTSDRYVAPQEGDDLSFRFKQRYAEFIKKLQETPVSGTISFDYPKEYVDTIIHRKELISMIIANNEGQAIEEYKQLPTADNTVKRQNLKNESKELSLLINHYWSYFKLNYFNDYVSMKYNEIPWKFYDYLRNQLKTVKTIYAAIPTPQELQQVKDIIAQYDKGEPQANEEREVTNDARIVASLAAFNPVGKYILRKKLAFATIIVSALLMIVAVVSFQYSKIAFGILLPLSIVGTVISGVCIAKLNKSINEKMRLVQHNPQIRDVYPNRKEFDQVLNM